MSTAKKMVLALAWPEVTARSEDAIMKLLRNLQIVKNLNVQVGHAAMIIVDGNDLRYYDFGRYITPKHLGRVRSGATDPNLRLATKAIWNQDGELENLDQICEELNNKAHYTHGEGLIQVGLYYDVDVAAVERKALEQQESGLIPYATFNRSSSNCARFVQTSLIAGAQHRKTLKLTLKYPITFNAPTPYFNVLAATNATNPYWEWKAGEGKWREKPLLAATGAIIKNVYDSMHSKKAKNFQKDQIMGHLQPLQPRPEEVPQSAVYLGGLGEAAWYDYKVVAEDKVHCRRWLINGELDFEAHYHIDQEQQPVLLDSSLELTHDSHFRWITIKDQKQEKFRIYNSAQ